MALPRHSIEDFSLANNAYVGAEVTFFIAGAAGIATATKATLYQDLTGVAVLPNPQTLNSKGFFNAPVYVDVDVIAQVSSGAASGDTGVISYGGANRGTYVTATSYFSRDIIIGPSGQVPDVTGNLYESTTIFDSTTWAADLAKLTLLLNYQALIAGVVPFSTIADILTGTATGSAVTPDALASIWQQGADVASATTLVKPVAANLGGVYRITGNVQIDNIWAGTKDGEEVEFRYIGTPLVRTAGNMIPPAGANFQVIAGDMIRSRWDATAAKWRAYGGMRADGTFLVATGAGAYQSVAVDTAPTSNGGITDFSAAPHTATHAITSSFKQTYVNSAASGVITISPASGTIDGLASRKLGPGDRVTVIGDGTNAKTIGGTYTYESGEQTIAAAALLTLAHGLGVVPKTVEVWARCKTNDASYVVGEEILLCTYNPGSGFGTHRGTSIRRDATNIKVRTGSGGVSYLDATAGTDANLTLANWKYLVRAAA